MKIGIDGLPLFGKAGVSVYQTNLLKAMLNIGGDHQFQLFLRTFKKDISALSQMQEFNKLESFKTSIPDRILEYFWIKRGAKAPFVNKFFKQIDVYFSTTYFTPVTYECPIVSTVYDITPLKIEEYRHQKEDFDLKIKALIKASSHILTISENTKKDLCATYDVSEKKVTATPLACHERFKPVTDNLEIKVILKKYDLDNFKYILYVGNLGPHKNLSTVLEVFKQLKEKEKIEHKLVLVGQKQWGGQVLAQIKTLELENHVIVTDYVADEDLPYIYNGAEVFVYVSLYEGFGLPPLEAMSCGVPVISSNTTSLPEVVSDAGVQIDPKSQRELRDAILQLIGSQEMRSKLRTKGIEQAKNFSWNKTAETTLQVLRSVN